MRYVYLFHEGNARMKELLGGKGANLAEMTNIGLPVPCGMTITTDACREYYNNGKKLPEGLVEEVTRNLKAIEEEAGSEASAKEINEITALVKEKNIPVIFTEVNGSDATAKAIARETGCTVAQLSMCMDGPDGALSNYYDALMGNVTAIINGFAGEELVR